jgi:16S rRNA C1402 N4-methylase RsmH
MFHLRCSPRSLVSVAAHTSRRNVYHIPVLKNDCIDYLMNGPTSNSTSISISSGSDSSSCHVSDDNAKGLRRGGLYLDCTLGGGGKLFPTTSHVLHTFYD